MSNDNPRVDFYFQRAEKWRDELAALRAVVLGSGLSEELKWGVPCYTALGRNVLLLHAFRDYCAVLFMKGALLPDPRRLLVAQTANTQAARQLRFASAADVAQRAPALRAYVQAAIELEKAGTQVRRKATAEFAVPAELQQQLAADPALQAAFRALTPGRQRGYLLYFAAPKQAKTREARIAKYRSAILQGKGLQD
ncbi:YdeI/OmpD-associated family protein [Hymenobacter sp. DH14]|uniref:YdeI/OmpD-associated family protein n=1 Tax=Hymenobacter cyanobacteriorum TaxID=2926463 RepID=A0A9X2AEJ8_9BACT|nr:YdeI/OmpD-associated family protein [Hymenobacter cyanobacteriorum]MCI1186877.1 YdeI/OmpD-associated family protein [Hymenobacter cyanobacteriorum]